MTQFVNPSLVKETVKNAGSKMFSVSFLKKDGTVRKVNGQLVESPPSHANHKTLFSIHLANGQGVRTASYDKVLRLASQGQVIASKDYKEA